LLGQTIKVLANMSTALIPVVEYTFAPVEAAGPRAFGWKRKLNLGGVGAFFAVVRVYVMLLKETGLVENLIAARERTRPEILPLVAQPLMLFPVRPLLESLVARRAEVESLDFTSSR
jgi:hypothetical protein